MFPEPPEANGITGVRNNLWHGLECHPTEAYGGNEYPQSPEAKIESRVHGRVLHIDRGVQSVEGSHATTTYSMKGATNTTGGHEREGVDEENGDQSYDHEELGEAGVVMVSGALEQLRRQHGHLGVHALIDD